MSTPDGPHFLDELAELAVRIELACAAVYEAFAEASGAPQELVTFWHLYAEAERHHAATLRMHLSTFAPGGFGPTEAMERELDRSRAFLAQLEAWRYQARSGSLDAIAMFRIAEQIESHTVELHGRTRLFQKHPHFETLFRELVEEDEEHRELLGVAAARFMGTQADDLNQQPR